MSQSHSVKDTVILLFVFTVLVFFGWWAADRTEAIASESCNHGFMQSLNSQDTLVYLKENPNCLHFIEVRSNISRIRKG